MVPIYSLYCRGKNYLQFIPVLQYTLGNNYVSSKRISNPTKKSYKILCQEIELFTNLRWPYRNDFDRTDLFELKKHKMLGKQIDYREFDT